MPPTAQQRALVGQFVSLTEASDKTALKFLKQNGFKLDVAIDAYFSAGDPGALASASLEAQLNKLFDELKRDPKQDGKDEIAVGSTMEYFSSNLGINIENAELLVAMEIVQAPSVGVVTRKEYVQGWKTTSLPPSQHAPYVKSQIRKLNSDKALFKRVYRHTFIAGKESSQKALDLETALVYWELLFTSPGMPWKSASYDWLGLWKQFLQERWPRSVNRDMWNQTLEFALRTIECDGFSFWREDSAWPSVLDDFVQWGKEKGIRGSNDADQDMAQ